MEEDLKLVEQILKGNVDSFNFLVRKYEKNILRFIYNIVKDKEAAEDIAQEVFITIYNKLYTYNKKYKFYNWILQISKNKCIDYMRKYKRVYEANIDDVRDVSSSEMLPEERTEFNETKKMVEQYVNNLEEIDKQIVCLRYSTDITFHDIGEILKISESSVKRRFYKVRENFKNSMKRKEKRCN